MNIKGIVLISLFTAVTVILGIFPPITFPIFNVPLVLQNIGPMLAGSILGAKRGFMSILLFLFLVAIGFPFLSGGRGGFGFFLSPGAGFILSWPLAALLIGYLVEKFYKGLNFLKLFLFMFLGSIILNYFFGILWLCYSNNLPFKKVVLGCSVFIPGDVLKIFLTSQATMIINKHYRITKN